MKKIKVIVYGFFDNGYDNWVMYVKDELLVKVKKCIFNFCCFLVFFSNVIVFLYVINFFYLILG